MMYDEIRSRITRQELETICIGQHYNIYSAKVKYAPESIEKEDFFSLCYNMLRKCDEVTVIANKLDGYDMIYKFVVIDVNMEAKTVATKMLYKIDVLGELNNGKKETDTEKDSKGADEASTEKSTEDTSKNSPEDAKKFAFKITVNS